MTNITTTATQHINHRQTFGNAVAGQAVATVVRHIVSFTTKAGECGIVPAPYALYRTYEVATKINKAPICETCLDRFL